MKEEEEGDPSEDSPQDASAESKPSVDADETSPQRSFSRRRKIAVSAVCAALIVLAVGCVMAFSNPPAGGDLLQTVESSSSTQTLSAVSEETSSTDSANVAEADGTEASSADGEQAASVSTESAPAATADATASSSAAAASKASASTAKTTKSSESTSAAATIKVSCTVSSTAADGSVSASTTKALPEKATALDALKATGLSYATKSTQYGTYVSAIGGLSEKDKRFGGGNCGWTYTVNGAMPSMSADACTLSDGDTVAWSFVTW